MSKKAGNKKEYDKKKFLYFDFNNPNDVMLYELMSKAPRRLNKLIGIMAREFMDNFGITQDVPKDELIKIIDMYDIVKNMKTRQVIYSSQSLPVIHSEEESRNIQKEEHNKNKVNTSKEEDNINNDSFSDAEMDELAEALSGFNMD